MKRLAALSVQWQALLFYQAIRNGTSLVKICKLHFLSFFQPCALA